MRLLGVDVGGTFTDLALLDLDSQELWTHKLLTTPEEPERAVMEGVRFLVDRAGGVIPVRIVHGTTLITNAIVERKGAVTALLTIVSTAAMLFPVWRATRVNPVLALRE